MDLPPREVHAVYTAHWPDEMGVVVAFGNNIYRLANGASNPVPPGRAREIVRALLSAALAEVEGN